MRSSLAYILERVERIESRRRGHCRCHVYFLASQEQQEHSVSWSSLPVPSLLNSSGKQHRQQVPWRRSTRRSTRSPSRSTPAGQQQRLTYVAKVGQRLRRHLARSRIFRPSISPRETPRLLNSALTPLAPAPHPRPAFASAFASVFAFVFAFFPVPPTWRTTARWS